MLSGLQLWAFKQQCSIACPALQIVSESTCIARQLTHIISTAQDCVHHTSLAPAQDECMLLAQHAFVVVCNLQYYQVNMCAGAS